MPLFGKRALPGGFGKGDPVYFCAAGETLTQGCRYEYGEKGLVVGPCDDKTVFVRFPGNPRDVFCLVASLSRTWPPPPCRAALTPRRAWYR
jgi:hypothetical protein